ncbi:ABC transporter permease/substrate-binding protein [Lactococcus termiticola]|uniref:Glycine betaine/carnitine/choline ABC transporter substrate-binding and permease protein n=1 Tax=Lactococcus termiticola TaxID=2169526 RepID=A0A2R5HFS1_9LACT|nr:ABC transporter permease/substrate-binding protein [Lactococcus termiticola]GBG96864.1 glycine betaine/carnitine/choline ABC transporter substrate-binding and permease protein [Lactococcus termiticola]
MKALIQTFQSQKGSILQAVFEHLSLSLFAVLIAVLIAIPLAILVARHKRLAGVVLQITGVFQTIPSLALLGLLIPFLGIGTVPTLVALVVYALLPIFQNTYVGLDEIDPAYLEAADAFGLTRWQRLIKVELPLALPVIISGVRTALVFIIGTATLGGLIGAGGLGTFIVQGLQQNNFSLMLIGAIGAALLAIILSGLVAFLQKRRPRVAVWTLLVLFVLVGAVNVQQSGIFSPKEKQTITIAGKLGTEPEILINMYKDIIEANDKNVDVVVKPSFGNTTFLFSALKAKQIDVYPEFTGTIWTNLVKQPDDLKNKTLSDKETYNQSKKLIAQQFNMTYLAPMSFQDTYTIAVKKDYAEKNGLKSISDLKNVQATARASFDSEFKTLPNGYLGLGNIYGLKFATEPSTLDETLAYTAINSGKIDVIDAYSTDAGLEQFGLVSLDDDKKMFPNYQAAPLMNTAFAKSHPEVVKALDKLAGHITTDQMREMNYKVAVEKQSASKVAEDYLKESGLIK